MRLYHSWKDLCGEGEKNAADYGGRLITGQKKSQDHKETLYSGQSDMTDELSTSCVF